MTRMQLTIFVCFLLACGREQSTVVVDPTVVATAPRAKVVPHILETHGHSRNDPYYWLRDEDRDDPEILSYLAAENSYLEERTAHLAPFRSALFDEMVARIEPDDSTVPFRRSGYWYYTRYETGKEHPVFCRRRGSLDAPEEVMLDANVEAARHEYYVVSETAVSAASNLLAYSEDTLGRRIFTVRFRDLGTGQVLSDSIPGTAGLIAWALDNRTLFYLKREEETLRAYQVWRHTVGSDSSSDVLVYEEPDSEFDLTLRRTKSQQYIVLASYQTLSHEMRVIPADTPTSAPRVFLPRESHHEYDIEHFGDRFYIRTNWGARDFRLMSVSLDHSDDKSAWREEVPARDGVFFADFDVFENYLVVSERQQGISGLRVIPWNDRSGDYAIPFDEQVYVAELGTNHEIETDILRLDYSSLRTPDSVVDFDMSTRERRLMKREVVRGGFDPENYATERLMVTARDGATVPISLVYRRSLDRSVPQPLLLYGYGAYGYSIEPRFQSKQLSLLDRGVIYAIAHVRGGQELGRRWYEEGRLLNKRNTFTDFIDCAEHLVREGWTRPDRLFAYGASAGGLTMGAVANMRPDLFTAIVADVPFVDVLTTMLDESIPLTTFEYDEWGNPNERPYYDYILSYSPYDNVVAQDYPNLLVLSGLHDSQVQYWEPAKWVARLRAEKTDQHQLFLYTDMAAGHSGPSGRFQPYRETALVYAFLLDLVGMRQ